MIDRHNWEIQNPGDSYEARGHTTETFMLVTEGKQQTGQHQIAKTATQQMNGQNRWQNVGPYTGLLSGERRMREIALHFIAQWFYRIRIRQVQTLLYDWIRQMHKRDLDICGPRESRVRLFAGNMCRHGMQSQEHTSHVLYMQSLLRNWLCALIHSLVARLRLYRAD